MAESSTLSTGLPDMRRRLVSSALELLRRDGAAALTVRNITAEAGCSTTGIYTYFGGKHGVVESIFVDGFDSFDGAVDPYLEADDLIGSGRAYRRWALANPTQYMVMFGRAVPSFEPSDEARLRALMSFAKLAEAVANAIGDTPDEAAPDRAYRLFATVHGYVMLELAGMAGPTPSESERLYDLALASVARHPA